MFALLKKPVVIWLFVGAILGISLFSGTLYSFVATSETEFCISCHEMRIVAEQGWMLSSHYKNKHGVVAQCVDCHIPHTIVDYVIYKVRDGITDVVVHTFGESDPYKMDWDRLRDKARSHHKDSVCIRCHQNLVPEGLSIKGIVAHREYLRGETDKNCIQCHDEEIHPKFKDFLFGETFAKTEGAKP